MRLKEFTGKVVAHLRTILGLSQRRLAGMAHLTGAYVSRLESGKLKEVTWPSLMAVGNCLGGSPAFWHSLYEGCISRDSELLDTGVREPNGCVRCLNGDVYLPPGAKLYDFYNGGEATQQIVLCPEGGGHFLLLFPEGWIDVDEADGLAMPSSDKVDVKPAARSWVHHQGAACELAEGTLPDGTLLRQGKLVLPGEEIEVLMSTEDYQMHKLWTQICGNKEIAFEVIKRVLDKL